MVCFQRLLPSLSWLPDWRSIQFRLTAGVVLTSVLGIGGVAGWMNWRMQHILLDGHKQSVSNITERFSQDVSLYAEIMPMQTALARVIDHRAIGDTAIWITAADGEIVAQSETLSMGSWQAQGFSQQLLQLPTQERLEIMSVGDRYLVVCVSPLRVEGQRLGSLFVVDDITEDQRSLLTLTRNLALVSSLMILLLAIVIAIYVQRSLRPIRTLGQQVADVTPESLNATRLRLDQAPTEVRQLAQTLDMALERLAMAWEQQRRLACDVSHELRTPLTVVQGYLQSTLRRCRTLSDPQREGLEMAAAETDRTIRILQDLLTLARANSGFLNLNLQRVDLKTVVLDATAQANCPRPSPPDPTGDRLTVTIETPPITVRADPQALRQVLINLIDNALHYSPPDQPVTVRLTQETGWAVIQVRDRGRGIPAASLNDIFHPFYRVDADRSRATGGTGLGLSIVKTLIEGMQGQIHVQSKLGEGSTFTVRLPA